MPNFKITLAYDGTAFVGWQRQASGVSIQGLLEDAIRDLAGRDVTVIGAGRTDAGVHALGQVASVSLERTIAAGALMRALNARLPGAVRVMSAEAASPAFHARHLARAKTYRYRIWNAEVIPPFERQYAWHLTRDLDVDRMAAAARLLDGAHDFAAFQTAGSSTSSTQRTVSSSRVRRFSTTEDTEDHTGFDLGVPRVLRGGALIIYEITGDGFLRHMVRSIVGTLVEIGRGHRPVDWIDEVRASGDRTRAGPTAPSEGLFLVSVRYDDL